ncbi:HFL223Wp [Eremothecium sinecaudum]|uniref:HFL223Wp n=1 Tax=Eremothecium sinecaudum TaxID=45286 RepID=A0A120K2I3_9SACH|nr:HFL223Wp [Eremothecium sinecaudum]AMD21633.1 HFL223Wp [Eremothecium sinecaudum]
MICSFVLLIFVLFETILGKVVIKKDLQQFQDDNGIIHLTEDIYKAVSSTPRNFYSILFITSSTVNTQGKVCDLCHQFTPTWNKVAWTFTHTVPEKLQFKFVFFEVDVSANPSLVKDLSLTTMPHCIVYQPGREQDFAWNTSGFYEYALTPETAVDVVKFANFIAKTVSVWVKVKMDFQNDVFLSYFIAVLVGILTIKKVILPRVKNKGRFFCCMFSILAMVLSITGFKFTQMNAIPFIAKDADGGIMYFAGSSAWQFGIEIFSVSLMYLGMGLCVLIMIFAMGQDHISHKMKIITACIMNMALFCLFAYFLSCYKLKVHNYPYTL